MADNDKTYTQAELDAEVAGLKRKNAEVLGELKTMKETLASLEAFKGLDPEKVKEAMTAAEKAEADKHRQAGDWEAREKALRDQMAKEHTAILEPLQTKLKQLETGLFRSVAERDALEAMGKPDVKGNSALLLPVILPELEVQTIEGRQVTVVKGPDGKPRYRMTDNALFTVEDRLKELRAKPEYGGAFEGTGTGGTGADRGGGSGGKPVVQLTDQKSFLAQVDKIASGEVTVAS